MNDRQAYQSGFTLIEMLVVVAIIGVLLAILAAPYGSILKNADKATATANLGHIVKAMQLYAVDYHGHYPSTTDHYGDDNPIIRFVYLYNEGYITDPKVFVDPINARKTRGMGVNTFGPGLDCYFYSPSYIFTSWSASRPDPNTAIKTTDLANTMLPIVWDQRADSLYPLNFVTTSNGGPAGFFGYGDGSVELIGPPNSVVRGNVNQLPP